MTIPEFLKNLDPLTDKEMRVIKNQGISWPKIMASLPEGGRERLNWIKHYMVNELRGFNRARILSRLTGQYVRMIKTLEGVEMDPRIVKISLGIIKPEEGDEDVN